MTSSSSSYRQSSGLSACDFQALKDHHEFVRDDDKDKHLLDNSWERRMARKFYNKLYKEFALIDLSKYQDGSIGLRWRTESEVENGKGQHSCGGLNCLGDITLSSSSSSLHSYEVPFQYIENGQKKLELVKVRLCHECSEKLFFHRVKQMKKSKSNSKSDESYDVRVRKANKSKAARDEDMHNKHNESKRGMENKSSLPDDDIEPSSSVGQNSTHKKRRLSDKTS